MKTLKLSRRAVLKGLGGVTLALPLLDVMLDGSPALAGTSAAMRYAVMFCGQSMGADFDPLHNDFVPDKVGRDYDLKSALAPLSGFGDVRQEVSVVSGLRIPTANGGQVPAGGRPDDFHVTSASPLLTGVRATGSGQCYGATSDQIMAGVLGGNPAFKSLVYRVQAAWYLSVAAPYGRDLISYKLDSNQLVVPIPSEVSPQRAFASLFGNFIAPGVDATQAGALAFRMRMRGSVLDLVKGRAAKLIPRLGQADKIRVQRHLDELRDLELRVQSVAPAQTSTCGKPLDPRKDPAVGGDQGVDGSGNTTYGQNLGYSGEDARAKLFCDLVHMAFTCDLTRVATLQLTLFQSHMNMYSLTGQACDLHEIGHGGVPGGTKAMAKAQAWHVKQFAYLVAKLRDTTEASGGTLLDHSALVFLMEGGHGADPGSGREFSSHSTENMACLVAGRAGGLKPGQHIAASGLHPAQVVLTAMKAVGYSGNSLGEVSGDVPALRV